MPVEGLHALAGTDVPHRDCLVTRSRREDLRVGLPLNGVDGVDVTAESEAGFVHVQIPHLD